MPEQDEQDRWSQLARELGLEPGPEPAAAPPPAPPAVPEPPREPVAKALPARQEEPPAEELLPRARRRRESAPPEQRADLATHGEELFGEPAAAALGAPESAERPAEVASGDEDHRPGRRRRGRRADHNGAADAPMAPGEPGTEPVEAEGPPSEPQGEAAGEERPRRRRGRGRRRGSAPNAEAPPRAEALPRVSAEPETIEMEDMIPPSDEEADQDLSGWNVPTWQELIASLYRPPDR